MDNLKGKIVLLISGGEQPLEEPKNPYEYENSNIQHGQPNLL